MISLPALSPRQLLTVAVVTLLVVPSGAFAAGSDDTAAFAEDEVDFARTTEEVKGYLIASAGAAANGETEMAKELAAEPYHEHWSAMEPQLSAVNQTLSDSVKAELQALPSVLEEKSPSEYEAYLESEVFPLLSTAEAAVVSDAATSSTKFQATVVNDLLQRSIHEYTEGVNSAGEITEEGEIYAAKGFALRSEARYDEQVSSAVSEHGNEEVVELYELVITSIENTEPPESVEQYSASLSGELAEYTGIEVEQSGSAEAIERIEADLHEAIEKYDAGETAEAKAIVKQTYLSNFEGVEGTLIEEDPELVEELEAAFNEDLPSLMDGGASTAEVTERVEQMEENLETAETILASQEDTEISLGDDDDDSTTTESTTTTTETQTETPGFSFVTIGIAAFALIAYLIRRD